MNHYSHVKFPKPVSCSSKNILNNVSVTDRQTYDGKVIPAYEGNAQSDESERKYS